MPLPRRRSRTSCKPSLKVRENLEWEQELKFSEKKATKSTSKKKTVIKNRKDRQLPRSTSPEDENESCSLKKLNLSGRTNDHKVASSRSRSFNGSVDDSMGLDEANETSEVAPSISSRDRHRVTDVTKVASGDDASYSTRRSKRGFDTNEDERNVKRPFQNSGYPQASKDNTLSPHQTFDGIPTQRSQMHTSQTLDGGGKSSQSSGSTADTAVDGHAGHSQSGAVVATPSYCSFFAGEGPDGAGRNQGDTVNGDKSTTSSGGSDSMRMGGKAPNQAYPEYVTGMQVGGPAHAYYPGPYWVSPCTITSSSIVGCHTFHVLP